MVLSILMNLSVGQLEKIADLCMDLAKGLFLATLAGPVINDKLEIVLLIKTFIAGCFFAFISLKAIEEREVLK